MSPGRTPACPRSARTRNGPVFACFLGPAVDPATKSPAGNLWANGRVWAALGLLLTAKTIAQARDLSRERDGGFFFDPAD